MLIISLINVLGMDSYIRFLFHCPLTKCSHYKTEDMCPGNQCVWDADGGCTNLEYCTVPPNTKLSPMLITEDTFKEPVSATQFVGRCPAKIIDYGLNDTQVGDSYFLMQTLEECFYNTDVNTAAGHQHKDKAFSKYAALANGSYLKVAASSWQYMSVTYAEFDNQCNGVQNCMVSLSRALPNGDVDRVPRCVPTGPYQANIRDGLKRFEFSSVGCQEGLENNFNAFECSGSSSDFPHYLPPPLSVDNQFQFDNHRFFSKSETNGKSFYQAKCTSELSENKYLCKPAHKSALN